MPEPRINFYIFGQNKDYRRLRSEELARTLYPNIKTDDEIFFVMEDEDANIDGYDGQPVIIWDNKNAKKMLKELGGTTGFLHTFDPYPSRAYISLSRHAICLTNTINIVNSEQDYESFLNEIVGYKAFKNGKTLNAECRTQSRRRVPVVISLHQDGYNMLLNKGAIKHNREYETYIPCENIDGTIYTISQIINKSEDK